VADEGEWAVVMEVFRDGSALVRVEEGRDVALTEEQVGEVEPGEAGRLFNRENPDRALLFVARGRP
jgi:hypothetical protein